MLQHDHHECACATSLTFTNTVLVFEVLLFAAVECQGGRGKWSSSRINNGDRESR